MTSTGSIPTETPAGVSRFPARISHMPQQIDDSTYDRSEDNRVADMARNIGSTIIKSLSVNNGKYLQIIDLHDRFQDLEQEFAHRLKLSLLGFVSYNKYFAGIFPESETSYKSLVNCLMVRCILDNNLVINQDHERLILHSSANEEKDVDNLEYERIALSTLILDEHVPAVQVATLRRRTFFFVLSVFIQMMGIGVDISEIMFDDAKEIIRRADHCLFDLSCVLLGYHPRVYGNKMDDFDRRYPRSVGKLRSQQAPELTYPTAEELAIRVLLAFTIHSTSSAARPFPAITSGMAYLNPRELMENPNINPSVASIAELLISTYEELTPFQLKNDVDSTSSNRTGSAFPNQTGIIRMATGFLAPDDERLQPGLKAILDRDALYISQRLAPIEKHVNRELNRAVVREWISVIKKKRLKSLLPCEIGDAPKFQSMRIRIPLGGEDFGETFAFGARSVFSKSFVNELIEMFNSVPFIESSSTIGSSMKRRIYRVTQGTIPGQSGGGLFTLSNDPRPIGSHPMTQLEAKLVAFICEMLGIQDRLIEDSLEAGEFMIQWNPSQTVIPTMVAKILDSFYGAHKDRAFHHNHERPPLTKDSNDLDKELFLTLPHLKYMRVFTIILSRTEGDNAKLVFLNDDKPIKGKDVLDSGETIDGIMTDHASFHFQGPGLQAEKFKHNITKHGSKVTEGERVVTTGRINLPGDRMELSIYAAQKFNQNTSLLHDPRCDYNIQNVVEHVLDRGELVRCTRKRVSTFGDETSYEDDCEGQASKRQKNLHSMMELLKTQDRVEQQLIESFKLRHDVVDSTDFFSLCGKTIKQDRQDPPGGQFSRWYEDTQPLMRRLLSDTFVRELFSEKIQLMVKVPKENDEAHTLNSSQETIQAIYGITPEMDVLYNIREGLSRVGRSHIQPGDILDANSVRSLFGLPLHRENATLWRTGSRYCCNGVALTKYQYKDDYEGIVSIVRSLTNAGGGCWSHSHQSQFENKGFWMGGSGGSGQPCGQNAVTLGSLGTTRPKPAGTFPHPMDLGSDLNATMNHCASARQVIHVFIPVRQELIDIILEGRGATDESTEDTMSKFGSPNEKFLFLGLYSVDGSYTYRETTQRCVETVQGMARKLGCAPESIFWNYTYLMSNHLRFKMKWLPVPWDILSADSFSLIRAEINTDGPLASQKLYHTIDNGEDLWDKMESATVDMDEYEKQFLLPVFRRSYLPLLVSGKGALDKDRWAKEMSTADASEPDREDSSYKPEHSENVSVNETQLVGILCRMGVAAAARCLGHATKNKKNKDDPIVDEVGFLPGGPDGFEDLGEVVRASPTPHPNRGLDVTTNFILSRLATMDGFFKIDFAKERDFGFMIQRIDPVARQTNETIMMKCLSTIFLCRLTGRVEEIRHYLEQSTASIQHGRSTWDRPLTEDDLIDFPLYLLATDIEENGTQEKMEELRRTGKPVADKVKVMGRVTSTQYKSSIPKFCKQGTRKFRESMDRLPGRLRELVTYLSSEYRKRSEVISKVTKILKEISTDSEDEKNVVFMAEQITADLNEIFSRDPGEHDEAVGDLFLEDDYFAGGYGGTQGLSVIGRGVGVRGAFPRTPTGDEDTDNKNKKVYEGKLRTITTKIIEHLKKQDQGVLNCMGFYLSKKAYDDDDGGTIRSLVNGRPFCFIDVEHGGCKVYIGLHRSKGTRYYSVPCTWRPHCYPTIYKDCSSKGLQKIMNKKLREWRKLQQNKKKKMPRLDVMFQYPVARS